MPFDNIPKINDLVYVEYKKHGHDWIYDTLATAPQEDFPARVTSIQTFIGASTAEITLMHPSGKTSQYTASNNAEICLATKYGICIYGPETLLINFSSKKTTTHFVKVTTDEL